MVMGEVLVNVVFLLDMDIVCVVVLLWIDKFGILYILEYG